MSSGRSNRPSKFPRSIWFAKDSGLRQLIIRFVYQRGIDARVALRNGRFRGQRGKLKCVGLKLNRQANRFRIGAGSR